MIFSKKGYSVGWSNQSFEYWLYLHFDYSDADLDRNEWNKKLDVLLKTRCSRSKGYDKNIEDIYELLDTFGSVKGAVANAKRRMGDFDLERQKPSECAPGTTVYALVEKLLDYLQ